MKTPSAATLLFSIMVALLVKNLLYNSEQEAAKNNDFQIREGGKKG